MELTLKQTWLKISNYLLGEVSFLFPHCKVNWIWKAGQWGRNIKDHILILSAHRKIRHGIKQGSIEQGSRTKWHVLIAERCLLTHTIFKRKTGYKGKKILGRSYHVRKGNSDSPEDATETHSSK